MKKLFSLIFTFIFLAGTTVFANDADSAKAFFNRYVSLANSWNNEILNFYSPNAKIIRQVVKPNGELVNATTNWSVYRKQLIIGQKTAQLKKYTNSYRNITVTKYGNGYKISAERQPKGENYWLKIYQIVQKQNGKWVITEELMQTKEQIFLNYADKN